MAHGAAHSGRLHSRDGCKPSMSENHSHIRLTHSTVLSGTEALRTDEPVDGISQPVSNLDYCHISSDLMDASCRTLEWPSKLSSNMSEEKIISRLEI